MAFCKSLKDLFTHKPMMSNLAWEAIGRPAALEVFTLSEVPKNTELTLQYLPSYSNKVSIADYGFSIGNTKYVQEPIYFTKDEMLNACQNVFTLDELACYEILGVADDDFTPDDHVGHKCETWFPNISKWANKVTELSEEKNAGLRNF